MKILIVDDHREVRASLRRLLRRVPNLDFVEAESAKAAIEAIEDGVDLILLDIRLSDDPRDRSGLDVLREMRRIGRDIPAVIVSASSAMDDIREAMRLGARDYVLKDELCEELIAPIVDGFRERQSLTGEVQRLRARVDSDWGLDAIVGSSGTMQRVRSSVTKVAQSDAPVLILGETGTGKEMVARALHHLSPRRERPFVAVNCSAIPANLLESLLFGHERGAFTGADKRRAGRMAAAEDGTLLLDEVADLPLEVQGKLLRVLEDRRFLPVGADEEVPLRARILAATNADLHKRVQNGQFRSDLFFRLDVVTIRLPTLAERGGDLVELLLAFTEDLPRQLKFTDRAIEWLSKRPWPGNVRELRNVVRRLSIMSTTDKIDVPTLVELVATPGGVPETRAPLEALVDAVLAMPDSGVSKYRETERALLRRALDIENGNKAGAARLLGVPRKVLLRRWARLIERVEDDGDESDD
ncbi:MAG: sigma-54-dependent transcriptional regulator [Polyangiales bacterium]